MNFQNDAFLRLLQSELEGGASDGYAGEGRSATPSCRTDGEGAVNRRGCGGRGCVCGERSDASKCLAGNSLAMVYAPWQEFDDLYEAEEGLCHGTIFKKLDKPFSGGRVK